MFSKSDKVFNKQFKQYGGSSFINLERQLPGFKTTRKLEERYSIYYIWVISRQNIILLFLVQAEVFEKPPLQALSLILQYLRAVSYRMLCLIRGNHSRHR